LIEEKTGGSLGGMQGDAMRLGGKERAGDHHDPSNYMENTNAKRKECHLPNKRQSLSKVMFCTFVLTPLPV
jgi:hypothetical protein